MGVLKALLNLRHITNVKVTYREISKVSQSNIQVRVPHCALELYKASCALIQLNSTSVSKAVKCLVLPYHLT